MGAELAAGAQNVPTAEDPSVSASNRRVGPPACWLLADTDAGNVVTGAQAGAPLLIPMLYMLQELTVRLGIYTWRGHGELIRERFGVG
jgi:Mn2+/Fe2+ NRAMP family transporter